MDTGEHLKEDTVGYILLKVLSEQFFLYHESVCLQTFAFYDNEIPLILELKIRSIGSIHQLLVIQFETCDIAFLALLFPVIKRNGGFESSPQHILARFILDIETRVFECLVHNSLKPALEIHSVISQGSGVLNLLVLGLRVLGTLVPRQCVLPGTI